MEHRITLSSPRPLVEAIDLCKRFDAPRSLRDWLQGRRPRVSAADGLNLRIARGESVGLLGESGCGKTTVGRLLLDLIKPTSGQLRFDGMDFARFTAADRLQFRRRAQFVFQNPFDALNPRFTLKRSLMEPLRHARIAPEEHAERLRLALQRAQLSRLTHLENTYSHELSGGQLQRVALARALILSPEFIVADEPVSMLDVSVRAGILNVLREVQAELGLSALYISHDLTLVRYLCQRTIVMYLGVFVEEGPTAELIRQPLHPYTRALLQAVPSTRVNQSRAVIPILGGVPDALNPPSGCRFRDRCPQADARCASEVPALRDVGAGRRVACHQV
jgi:peptide/nickel transport system ATP-binding protein